MDFQFYPTPRKLAERMWASHPDFAQLWLLSPIAAINGWYKPIR